MPVPTKMPPQDEVYQVITWPVPLPPPLSVNAVLWPLQITSEPAVADVGSDGTWFTVIVTETQLELTEQGAPISYLP